MLTQEMIVKNLLRKEDEFVPAIYAKSIAKIQTFGGKLNGKQLTVLKQNSSPNKA
jgi:hypothetical protein